MKNTCRWPKPEKMESWWIQKLIPIWKVIEPWKISKHYGWTNDGIRSSSTWPIWILNLEINIYFYLLLVRTVLKFHTQITGNNISWKTNTESAKISAKISAEHIFFSGNITSGSIAINLTILMVFVTSYGGVMVGHLNATCYLLVRIRWEALFRSKILGTN